MKEKSYEGTIKTLAPKATFTRMANRLKKEFKEVFGEYDYSIIDRAIENIKKGQPLDETIECEHSSELGGYLGSEGWLCDKVLYYEEYKIDFGYDSNNDEYYISWYLFSDQIYHKKYFGNVMIGSFDFILYNTAKIKGEHRYLCTHRPPSPGAFPDGYVTYDKYSSTRALCCGEVTYHERLADEGYALTNYGLKYDKDWQEQRQAIIDSYERKHHQ